MKPKVTEQEQQPVIINRSANVPEASSSFSESPAAPRKASVSTEASVASAENAQSSSSTVAASVTEPPKLETLVSNAEKVTQEIERALKELKSSGMIAGNVAAESVAKEASESPDKPVEGLIAEDQRINDVFPQENLGEQQLPSPTSNVNNSEVATTSSEVTLQRQKSAESESEPSATVPHVKSDGEDESFADAVSEAASASTANSPPPSRPALDELSPAMNENEVVINEDESPFLEEEFDEDVLEIEIDDTEANISEFIQNYEILQPQGTPIAAEEEEQIVLGDNDDETEEQQTQEEEGDAEEEEGDEGQTESASNQGITKGEIEQLLTTLTSTFSEMEQFATKIKENIASEIQQQLAAAATTTQKKVKITVASHDHSEGNQSYI
ncbi:hypothetical protein Ocin01_12872, partial [Orchesella cincta]